MSFSFPRVGGASTSYQHVLADFLVRRIWKSFIPFHYLQVFQRGAYYATEVIPNQIAVIALNTMYFYDSNHGERARLPPYAPLWACRVVLCISDYAYLLIEALYQRVLTPDCSGRRLRVWGPH